VSKKVLFCKLLAEKVSAKKGRSKTLHINDIAKCRAKANLSENAQGRKN
jgi:hypothetical protein